MYWVSPLDTTIPGYGETTVFLPTHSASEVEQGADPHAPDQHRAADPHLRSAREVEGYHIRAQDGSIGHVEDFILDDADWTIRHLVVDTRNWLPGRRVLLSPGSVADIRWNDREVLVHLNREEIRKSPQYEPGAWVI
jgi:hypothetical protein